MDCRVREQIGWRLVGTGEPVLIKNVGFIYTVKIWKDHRRLSTFITSLGGRLWKTLAFQGCMLPFKNVFILGVWSFSNLIKLIKLVD